MANYVTNTSDKSKKTALICCLIGFIGIGGIQRFYVGKIGSGIIYLITGGWFFIGTLIDLIKIVTGTFTDAAGVALRQ